MTASTSCGRSGSGCAEGSGARAREPVVVEKVEAVVVGRTASGSFDCALRASLRMTGVVVVPNAGLSTAALCASGRDDTAGEDEAARAGTSGRDDDVVERSGTGWSVRQSGGCRRRRGWGFGGAELGEEVFDGEEALEVDELEDAELEVEAGLLAVAEVVEGAEEDGEET